MRPLQRLSRNCFSCADQGSHRCQRNPHSIRLPSDTEPVRETVFARPLFDAGKGSAYYFPGAVTEADGRRSPPRPQRDGEPRRSDVSHVEVPTRLAAAASKGRTAYIKTPFKQVAVDTAKPIVTSEELLHWRLDRYLYADVQPIHFYPNAKEPLFLLPPHAMVTSLGPEMDAVDRVYRQKGLFTPSEIAEVFFPVTPSYYVESTHVFKALPANVVFRLDSLLPRGLWVHVLLARYPMLFQLRRPKYQKSVVKLNSTMWFVRAHPLYKAADRRMEAYNADYKPHGGGLLHKHAPTGSGDHSSNTNNGTGRDGTSELAEETDSLLHDGGQRGPSDGELAAAESPSSRGADRKPLDVQIFDILVRHLPRVSSYEGGTSAAAGQAASADAAVTALDERYKPMPLVEWINSFSQAELDVLNLVPQARVLTVMRKYTRVFQLMTRAPVGDHSEAGQAPPPTFAAAFDSHNNLFIDRSELGSIQTLDEGFDAEPAAAATKSAPQAAASALGTTPTSRPHTQAEKLMREALQDDIVGLQDIISEHVGETGAICQPSDAAVPTQTVAECHVSVNSDKHGSCCAVDDALDLDQRSASDGEASADDNDDSEYDHLVFSGEDEWTNEVKERAPTIGGIERNRATPSSAFPLVELLPMEEDEIVRTVPSIGGRSHRREVKQPIEDELPSLELDRVMVRRLPPNIAPRSLSNFDESTSPCVPLVSALASFLNPPPSLTAANGSPATENVKCPRLTRRLSLFSSARTAWSAGKAREAAPRQVVVHTKAGRSLPQPDPPSAADLWCWVPVSRLYKALTPEHRRYVRGEFKGLVNFLRLHGELFELNEDFTHVIAHDPAGVIAPLVPSQKHFSFEERVILPPSFDDDDSTSASLVGEEERNKFAAILGHSQFPTTRQQLVLLDPKNPLLHFEVLEQELAEQVPLTGPVSQKQLMRSLPPLLRAVLPSNFSLSSNRLLVTWCENGIQMVQRRELGLPAALREPVMTPEDAVEALRAAIPVGGATVRALVRLHLPSAAVRALDNHYGSVYAAAAAFPHYFKITESSIGGRQDALVELLGC